jgi:hypothetical protein
MFSLPYSNVDGQVLISNDLDFVDHPIEGDEVPLKKSMTVMRLSVSH